MIWLYRLFKWDLWYRPTSKGKDWQSDVTYTKCYYSVVTCHSCFVMERSLVRLWTLRLATLILLVCFVLFSRFWMVPQQVNICLLSHPFFRFLYNTNNAVEKILNEQTARHKIPFLLLLQRRDWKQRALPNSVVRLKMFLSCANLLRPLICSMFTVCSVC